MQFGFQKWQQVNRGPLKGGWRKWLQGSGYLLQTCNGQISSTSSIFLEGSPIQAAISIPIVCSTYARFLEQSQVSILTLKRKRGMRCEPAKPPGSLVLHHVNCRVMLFAQFIDLVFF